MTTDRVREMLMSILRLREFLGTFTMARLRKDGEFEITTDPDGSGAKVIAVVRMSDQTVGVYGALKGYPLTEENILRAIREGLQLCGRN